MDVAAQNGRGMVVVDNAVGGAGACHSRRGHTTAAEDVASVEAAAQTFASDFAKDEAIGGGVGRRCGQGHGTTAKVVACVDMAARRTALEDVASNIERMTLLDGSLLRLRATPRGVLASGSREAPAAKSCGPGVSLLL